MGDYDSDMTCLGSSWEVFSLPLGGISIRVKPDDDGPTDLYKELAKDGELEPYTDSSALFVETLQLSEEALAKNELQDLVGAWKKVLEDTFSGNESIRGQLKEKIVTHALRLARTSPLIFGVECITFLSLAKRMEFKFVNFGGDLEEGGNPAGRRAERHDLAMWYACYTFLGKSFSYNGWDNSNETEHESVVSVNETLVKNPDPKQHVMKVTCDGEETWITQEAKTAMVDAIDAMANQPTVFFRCKHAITAVTKILDVPMLEYSMPQTKEELDDFNWDDVVPGREATYPKAVSPSDKDFSKVKSVHTAVKKDKDTRARAMGLPNGGVQSYCTYIQRWKQWRDTCAIYRYMNPNMSLNTISDLMHAQLKMCKSVDAMNQVMADDVRKHQAKLTREERKRQEKQDLEKQLDEAKQKEEEAKQLAAAAAAEEVKLQQEKQQLKDAPLEGRSRSEVAKKRQAAVQEKENQLKEAANTVAKASTEAKQIAQKRVELSRKKREVESAPTQTSPKKKVKKKNDVDRLSKTLTPRGRVILDGPEWSPPTKKEGRFIQYSKPGDKWSEESEDKLRLLSCLHKSLADENLVETPLTFSLVMEYVDDEELEFNVKVFIFLIVLIVREQSCSLEQAIAVLLALVEQDLATPQSIADGSEANIQTVIAAATEDDSVATAVAVVLFEVSTELVKEPFEGKVPDSLVNLRAIGLDDNVSSLLRKEVFGSTELVVGLHARKITTALDLHDWEESGIKEKIKIKMAKIPADHVKRSLCTWIPKGEKAKFHHIMEGLGSFLCQDKAGDWGRITSVINGHYSIKEKKALTDIALTITRFYKATKSGGRRRPRVS